MKTGLVTPLGEIHVYINNVRSDYDYEPHFSNIRSLLEQPVAGSYRIVISEKDWRTVRCVVALSDTELQNEGSTGERFFCSKFTKNNIALTIGAGDDIAEFETNQLRYGMEYIRRQPVGRVFFGVAWSVDHEGPDDIRTELAADIY